ncbi:hypothetical protein C8J56DRAFT_883954 [Mycena floridula]|nr:hypothetical protein C8J56DRAFT_883954 [Mycena floridula]
MLNRPRPVWHLTGEEQFNGKDFLKFQKQLLNQAYPVASARAARTSVMVAVATAAAAATTTWFSNTPNDSEYIECDATAASMIRLSCADPDAMGLAGVDSTAAQLYSFLTTKYIGQSELAKADEDYPTHEELLEKKWKVALAAGCDIKDAEFRSILIDSLPEQYDGCVDMLGNISIVAEVEAKLRSHWDIRVKPRIDASNLCKQQSWHLKLKSTIASAPVAQTQIASAQKLIHWPSVSGLVMDKLVNGLLDGSKQLQMLQLQNQLQLLLLPILVKRL